MSARASLLPAVAAAAAAVLLSACAIGSGDVSDDNYADRTVGQTFDDIDTLGRLVDVYGDAGPAFDDVDVDVIEGRVLLTGPVPSEAARDEASRMAYRERGVLEVLNELRVRDPKSFFSSAADARITTQLRAALQTSRLVVGSNFEIKTHERTVYLLGVARTPEEREAVVDIARTIGGVERIVDHVILADDPRRRGL